MLRYVLLLFTTLLFAGCAPVHFEGEEFPRKPIKVVVPFGAGGGSDTFTRIIQKAVQENELLDHPFVVINVPGAGGSIGSRRVKSARPDGYTILQIHDGMLTNKYSGNAPFGPEAFSPIAGTGQMSHIIAVPEDSPFDSLPDLIQAAAKEPDTIVFAVGIGAPSHFAGMMLEKGLPETEAHFRFAQSGGGAKRFSSLLGGHSQVTTFSVAEFIEFQASGLRALAILSEDRHELLPNIPTAIEQGVAASSTNMHFWWAPKGTPSERIAVIAKVLTDAMQLPQVNAQLAELATLPIVLTGQPLSQELAQREETISATAQRPTQAIPDFASFVALLTLALGCAAIIDHVRGSAQRTAPQLASTWYLQLALVVCLAAYIGVLQLALADYRFATVAFVLVVGAMHIRSVADWLPLIVVALLLGFGLHFVFTQVLVIDLP